MRLKNNDLKYCSNREDVFYSEIEEMTPVLLNQQTSLKPQLMQSSATKSKQPTNSPKSRNPTEQKKVKKVEFEANYFELNPFEEFAERKN